MGGGSIYQPANQANFVTSSPDGNSYWIVNIFNESNSGGNEDWGFDIGGGGGTYYKSQIRCVKD